MKKKELKAVSYRLPVDLLADIGKLAELENRNFTNTVEELLKRSVKIEFEKRGITNGK